MFKNANFHEMFQFRLLKLMEWLHAIFSCFCCKVKENLLFCLIFHILIFFSIRPHLELLPVFGLLRYMTPTLDAALLCSSSAGSDLGHIHIAGPLWYHINACLKRDSIHREQKVATLFEHCCRFTP